MSFRPLGDRVLVKISQAETISDGGIYIPTSAQEKPQDGIVVAVGPGKISDRGTLVEPRVKSGDHLLLPKYVGTEIRLENMPHLILSEDDILGVVVDED